MARPLRIEYPGAVYHVTARGNARMPVFESDADRAGFLELLKAAMERFNWRCYAYCLMDNHYHLQVETIYADLSMGMRHINGVFTQQLNRTHHRVGHLFQGRFKSILVDRDAYLLKLCRYIALNPVRAGMVALPEEYAWNSFRATAGISRVPAFLAADRILSQFGPRKDEARKRYIEFVKAGIGGKNVRAELKSQCIPGGERFWGKIEPALKDKSLLKVIPGRRRFISRPSLDVLLSTHATGEKKKRDEEFRKAHFEYGLFLFGNRKAYRASLCDNNQDRSEEISPDI